MSRAGVAVVALLAACVEPAYGPAPFLCGPSQGCPSGYACVGGRCQRGAGEPGSDLGSDAGADAIRPVDGSGSQVALDAWPAGTNSKKVRVVYLVAADGAENAAHTAALERMIKHLQLWFRERVGDGLTFSIPEPAVRVVKSDQPASYFTAPAGASGDEYGHRSRNEGLALVGAAADDPENGWIFISGVERPCDQGEGGGARATILSAYWLLQLVAARAATCAGEEPKPSNPCAAYGQVAYWIGAFGGASPTEEPDTLMKANWSYPDVELAEENRAALRASPLFSSHDVGPAVLWGCP